MRKVTLKFHVIFVIIKRNIGKKGLKNDSWRSAGVRVTTSSKILCRPYTDKYRVLFYSIEGLHAGGKDFFRLRNRSIGTIGLTFTFRPPDPRHAFFSSLPRKCY